jgi:hypothetical protein
MRRWLQLGTAGVKSESRIGNDRVLYGTVQDEVGVLFDDMEPARPYVSLENV